MPVNTQTRMQRDANAIDFWRGFALISIFINHIPGIFYEHFTHKNLSISDSADLFVFLAGWALRLSVDRPDKPVAPIQIVLRLGGRAVVIYAAHLLIVTVAIAMLAAAAVWKQNPLLLEWHNAAAVFYDPVNAHIGLALLTHQLGYFDILPLYVVLMLIGIVMVLLHRIAPSLLLPVSLVTYLIVLIWRIVPPSWPVEGNWFFNPLAWQLVFVLGFLLARDDGLGGWARRHLSWLRLVAVPIVVAVALMRYFDWWWDPTKVPEPRLLFLLSKTYVTPARLIQFLALLAVFSVVYPYIERWARPVADVLSMFGRNSLPVFCVGSILSLAAQIARYVYKSGFLADTLIVVAGIGALALSAWLADHQQGKLRRAQ